MNIEITYIDDDEDEVSVELPARHEVCHKCEGHGTILNPSIGEHAYSQEEFEEAFQDEEDRAAYFQRGGRYDVSCPTCHGNKVVQVVYEAKCTTSEQKQHLQAHLAHQRTQARWDAQDRATYRMESGGY